MSTEDTADDTIAPRLEAAGADMNQIIVVRPMVKTIENGKRRLRVFNIMDDLRRLKELIRIEAENGRNVRLVIFDPINAYFGTKDKADSPPTCAHC
jgi:hypothetical protein